MCIRDSDYNLAMYRTRYRNNRQLQSVLLIVMAKQQLLMSNYDLAAQALAMVDINCVKLPLSLIHISL